MRERVAACPSYKSFLTENSNIDALCMDGHVLLTDKMTGSEPRERTEWGVGAVMAVGKSTQEVPGFSLWEFEWQTVFTVSTFPQVFMRAPSLSLLQSSGGGGGAVTQKGWGH